MFNKKSPKISVVMPVYNGERYLDESINSILSQTFKDFEFIIINDGSTDNSKKVIRKYQKKDKRIIFIDNGKNLGLQRSLNKGLKKARAKYLARMDADDISSPKRLEIQHSYLETHRSIFLIGSSAIIINEKGSKLGALKKFDNSKKIKKSLPKSNPLIHPSIMFRNSKEFLYREKFKTSEDYDLYLRILSSDKKITNLPQPLVKYRITKNSFVSTMPNQKFYFEKAKEFYSQRKEFGKDSYDLLKEPTKKSYPENPEKNSLKSLIFIQLSDGQWKNVRRNIKKYFKKYGFDRTLMIYYFLSFFPGRIINFLREKVF